MNFGIQSNNNISVSSYNDGDIFYASHRSGREAVHLIRRE